MADLAALLHEADCQPNHLYCDGQRCEDIAARLRDKGIRVGDDGLDVLRRAEDWLREHGYNATANDVRIVIDKEGGDD